MASLSEILNDPNYINANEETKAAIFTKYAPQDENYTQANAATQAAIRNRFGVEGQPGIGAQGGFDTALYSGYQGLKGGLAGLAGRIGMMDVEKAKQIQEETEEKGKKAFKPTEEGWLTAPGTKFAETLGQSLPFMVAPIAAAGIATVAGAPGIAATGLSALASAIQFTGSNLQRQQERGIELEDTSIGGAIAAAIPQTALETLSFRMIPGVQKLFGKAGKEITEAQAAEIAKQGIVRSTAAYGAQGARTGGIEGATEVGQQFLERLQAGLETGNQDAINEYVESFIGGAVLGGTLQLPGTAMRRDHARQMAAQQQAATPPDETAPEPIAPPDVQDLSTALPVSEARDVEAQLAELEGRTLPLAPPPAEAVAQPAQPAQPEDVQGELPGEPVSEPIPAPVEQPAQVAQPTPEDIVPLDDKGEPVKMPEAAAPKTPEVLDPNIEAQLAAEPFDPDSIILPPKEVAPPPPPPVAKKPKAPKVAQVYYGKDAAGNTNVPVSEGGLPFTTKAEADAIKALQPELRVQKVKGGWLLGEKSEQYKAADKLRTQNLTKITVPGLIGDILRMGGLDPAYKSKFGFDEKENPSIGNRRLFAAPGKGVAPQTVTEMYMEDRPDEAEFTGQDIDFEQSLPDRIKSELKRIQSGERIETPEQAYERRQEEEALEYEAKQTALDKAAQLEAKDISAEVAAEQATEAADLGNFRQQMLDAGYTEQDLNVIGFTKASPELQAEVAALQQTVSAAGLDSAGILETLEGELANRNITRQEYYAKAKTRLEQAIREKAVQGGGRDVSQADVQEGAAREEGLATPAEQKIVEQPTPVQISPEQQKIDALNAFEANLLKVAPSFRAVSARGASSLKPKPLSANQVELIKDLAGKAIDLGMPASVLKNVSAAGATRMNVTAAISEKSGWLLLGNQWSSSSLAEKLSTVIHELGHSVDNKKEADLGDKVSDGSLWKKAHDELKNWYDLSETKNKHPLNYPFGDYFKGKVRPEQESFAQAFSLYFVNSVELQTNAPEAYSQIQSIVEGIQNESQRTSAASATKIGATGVNVQPSRTAKGATVQPGAGKVGSGLSKSERVEDRGDQGVEDIAFAKKPVQPTLPGVESKPAIETQIPKTKPAPTWKSLEEPTWKDTWAIRLFDKNLNLDQTQKEIEKTVKKIKDEMNAYRLETLSHGKIEASWNDFMTSEFSPIIKEMKANKITDEALTEYLVMRHAKEANDLIAERNPNNPAKQDKGSGISYEDRDKYFKKLDPVKQKQFESIASKVDSILQKTRNMLEQGGIITKENRETWEKMFEFYVPLRREESDYSLPSSSYRKVGDFAKSRTGSSKDVIDVLSNIAINREIAINRIEQERIRRAVYGLALTFPNPNIWMAVSPDAVKNRDILAQEIQDQFGMDSVEADSLVDYIMTEPNKEYFDKNTGRVVTRTDVQARYKDYVLPVKINGKDRFVFFNPKDPRAMQMVQSLKGLDAKQLPYLMAMAAPVTRFFSSVNTQFNLIFGAWNFARDIQGAQLNLSTTAIADRKMEVLKGTFKAMPEIYKALREMSKGKSFSDKSDGSWSDFIAHGGKVGYKDQFARLTQSENLVNKELKKLDRGLATRRAYATLNYISNINDVLENSTRLSAYRAALSKFKSEHKGEISERQLQNMKERAADIAKNLTVNFNRKGTWGATAGSLYAFFNASAQGTKRLYETLSGPNGKKIMAAGIAIGMAQAIGLAMAGFDEDEPTEFIKQKNLIIPTGDGGYAMWPMPFGFSIFPNLGRLFVESLSRLSKGKDVTDQFVNTITMLANSFNPLGGGGFAQMISPTVLDPAMAIVENRDAFGRPISRESRGTSPKPGYTLSRDPSASISQFLAEFVNTVTFGNADKRGLLSPTADQIDYLAGQVGGGVYRELSRAGKYAGSVIDGTDVPESQVPIAGKIVGSINSPQAISQRFYKNVVSMSEHEDAIKGRIKRRENVSEYMRDNPEASMWRRANALEVQISKLNTRRRELIQKDAPVAEIKKIDDQKTRMMKQFNADVRKKEAQ